MCTTQFYTMSYKRKRFLGIVDQLSSLFHCLLIYLRIWIIRSYFLTLHWFPFASCDLSILGKIKNYRTWTSTTSDIECTTYSPSHILWTTNLIRPFRDWLGYTHQVNFLESIGTQSRYAHLTSYDHDRGRIHHGISNTCQGIRCSRATGHESHAYIATDSSISLCCVSSSLLVTYQDVIKHFILSSRVTIQCIKHWHDATTWIAEDGSYPFVLQGAHQRFCSCYYFFCHSYLY